MRKLTIISLLISTVFLSGCINNKIPLSNTNADLSLQSPTPTPTPTPTPFNTMKKPEELLNLKVGQKILATLKTSLGDIKVELYPDKAPITVANFVGLSEGSQPWKDPKTGSLIENKSLYEGTIFHRVIDQFMIQGGDPLGQGIGGPGYQFVDEFSNDLKFDGPGYLAMANSGPGTNGSQFFITQVATTWLNGKHTILGKVLEGMSVVNKIAAVKKDASDKPLTPVTLNKVVIERK